MQQKAVPRLLQSHVPGSVAVFQSPSALPSLCVVFSVRPRGVGWGAGHNVTFIKSSRTQLFAQNGDKCLNCLLCWHGAE